MTFADFYAVAAASAVDPGEDVPFPEDGPNSNTGISRASESSFTLEQPGVYLVHFAVDVNGTSQLVLTLDDVPVAGTLTQDNQWISQTALIASDAENAVLTVRNPTDTAEAYASLDPGTCIARLVIVRLS